MSRIDKKKEALENINKNLAKMQKDLKRREWSIKKMMDKDRLNKLIEAGKLFEEAGILDSYDREAALRVLKSLNGGIEV